MSENVGFKLKLDRATGIADCAIALLDIQDPVERAIDGTYKAAVDHADALRLDGHAYPRALLIAYGGLLAVLDQLVHHTCTLGRLLNDPPAHPQRSIAAK